MSKTSVKVALKNGLGPALKRKPAQLIRPNELSEIGGHFKHKGELFYVVKWNTGEWPTMQTEEDLKDFEMDKVYYWEDWVALEPLRQKRREAQETREKMKSLGKEPFESPAVSSTSAPVVAPAATKVYPQARRSKNPKFAEVDENTDETDSTEDQETHEDDDTELSYDEVSEEDIDHDSEESDDDDDDEALRKILIAKKRKRTQVQNSTKNSTSVAKKLDFQDVTDYRTKNIIIAKRKNLKRL